MNWFKRLFTRQELYDYLIEEGYSSEEAEKIASKIREGDFIAEEEYGEWAYLNRDKHPLALHEEDLEHAVGVGSVKFLKDDAKIKTSQLLKV